MRERMNRRWSYFTMADVQEIADRTPVEAYTRSGLSGGDYMPEFSAGLSGKTYVFRMDGGDCYEYAFSDPHTLRWRHYKADMEEIREAVHEEYYDALELPGKPELILIQHYIRCSAPPASRSVILDRKTGLVTICMAEAGVRENPREIRRRFAFGICEGSTDDGDRHQYTDDLVGKAILWTYHEHERVRVKHIYTAPRYYTYQMTDPDGRCWVASNPADYVKIRDHVYVFSFVEERQAGTQGLFLMNLENLHDIGSFFGIQAHGMECCMFGAKGEWSVPFAYEWCGEQGKTER